MLSSALETSGSVAAFILNGGRNIMKRACLTTTLAVALAIPAYADITLKQTTEGKGLGMSGKSASTAYIKANKMRSDVVVSYKTQTTIFDVDAQKIYIFDSKKKEADVWDMAAFADEMSKSVDASSLKGSVKPNGQTKQIGGRAAAGYDMDVSMQSAIGGSKDMSMTVSLVGPMWVVKDAPGTADFARFYKAAAAKGFIFTDPRAAKAQPGQAKAM